MYCNACGELLLPKAVFCLNCGSKIENKTITSLPPFEDLHTDTEKPHLAFSPPPSSATQAPQVSERNEQIVAGWNWGACFLAPFWTWNMGLGCGWNVAMAIYLLSLIGGGLFIVVGLPLSIYLGINGNVMSWKSRKWDSVKQFNETQRIWGKWGIGFAIAIFLIIFGINNQDNFNR
jgi:hypothetical protein